MALHCGVQSEFGAGASIDIKFANTDKNVDNYLYSDMSQGRAATSKNRSALWVGFAMTGIPHAEGVVAWPSYDLDTRPTMWIDAECKSVNHVDGEEREVWVR